MSDSARPPTAPPSGGIAVPLLTDDTNLRDALTRIAVLGHEAVPACTAASITLIERGRAVTMGSSNDIAVDLDDAQYRRDAGPCLAAAREQRTIVLHDAKDAAAWPEFRAASARAGIASSISVPMTLGTDALEGGVNIYGAGGDAFAPADVILTSTFASQATAVVLNTRAYWTAAELARNLAVALETRGAIERAEGILMGTRGLTDEEAFDALRVRSQLENRTLHDVATSVLDETSGR